MEPSLVTLDLSGEGLGPLATSTEASQQSVLEIELSELDGKVADTAAGPPKEPGRREDKKPPGGLLANLDLSLAEIKLSDSPNKKKITKVRLGSRVSTEVGFCISAVLRISPELYLLPQIFTEFRGQNSMICHGIPKKYRCRYYTVQVMGMDMDMNMDMDHAWTCMDMHGHAWTCMDKHGQTWTNCTVPTTFTYSCIIYMYVNVNVNVNVNVM